jgi:hypothetical protein
MEPVTLLINDSPCSNEAVNMLKDENIPFMISPSTAPEVPCLRYKDTLFCGLGEIRTFIIFLGQERLP